MDRHSLSYLAGVKRKYTQKEEVEAYTRKIAEGLEPWEERILVRYVRTEHAILDLGCGAGREAFSLWKMGYSKIWGLDLSSAMIESARGQAKALGAGIHFEQGNVLEPLPPEYPAEFDIVLLIAQMICHIPGEDQRLALLDRIRESLKPGGKVILSTHNRYDGVVPRWRWALNSAFLGAGRLLGLTGRQSGDILSPSVSEADSAGMVYMHIFEPNEIPALLSAAGLNLLETASNTEITTGTVDPIGRFRDRYVFYVAQKP